MKTKLAARRTLPTLLMLLAAAPALAAGSAVARNRPMIHPPQNAGAPFRSGGLADANNRFGLNLFRRVTAAKADRNVLVSPLSATLALSMALNGSEGETRTELAHALALDGVDLPNLNDDSAYLIERLTAGRTDEKVRIANSLWADRDRFSFDDDYLSRVQSPYSAELRTLSFAAPGAVDQINGWVSDKTEKMIPRLLDHLPRETVAVLLNALYFQGTWAHPLYKPQGPAENFSTASGAKVPAQMLLLAGNDGYVETSALQMLSLAFRANSGEAYGENGDYRLDLILPAADQSVASVAAGLDAGAYDELVRGLHPMEVHGRIPRLKFDANDSLKATLAAMGVRRAFDPKRAQLNAFGRAAVGDDSNARLYIGDVIQGTAIDLDENGLKAAAATAVMIAARATAIRPEYREFVANRPFLLVLRHAPTGAILFAGQVADPSLK